MNQHKKIGLVIGKFMPLHNGHIELFKFALKHCDVLEVALVCKDSDPIDSSIREGWIVGEIDALIRQSELCQGMTYQLVKIEEALPRTEGHTEDAFEIWTDYFSKRFAHVDLIVSSEDYAEKLAKIMGIEHLYYDKYRKNTTVYASNILQCPEQYLELVPMPVREYLISMSESETKKA